MRWGEREWLYKIFYLLLTPTSDLQLTPISFPLIEFKSKPCHLVVHTYHILLDTTITIHLKTLYFKFGQGLRQSGWQLDFSIV